MAGVIGLILAAFAIYAAYAAELRRRAQDDRCSRSAAEAKGRQAVKGTYAQQIANVAHEPGVRQQL